MHKLNHFEEGWNIMWRDLSQPKKFRTTGGRKDFEVWRGTTSDHLRYLKSTGKECSLYKKNFKKGYEIFKKTKSLKTTNYRETMHGSYILPLLKEYFTEHRRMMERAIEILRRRGFQYHSAHEKGGSDIALFRDVMDSSAHFKDVDVVAWKGEKTFVVEIETSTRPAHLIGVIASINVSNLYKIGEKGSLKSLEGVILYVIIPDQKTKEKRQQIGNIEKSLELYLKEGSLKDFKIVTIEEFEKLL